MASDDGVTLARLERMRRGARIRGIVLPGRIAEMLEAAASRESWPIKAGNAKPLEWRAIDGIAALYDSPAGEALVTEWDGARGPVMPLKRVRGAALVRCPDGTAGWTKAKLGDAVPAPVCAAPRLSLETLNDAIEPLAGTPYRLGGASAAGFDCSALVQRVYLDAFDILLPRHSRDQMLAFDVERLGRRRGALPGDVVFLEMDRGCHAGIVCAAGIVHAAHSRGVVVDSMRSFRKIGEVIGVGRAEVAFATALLTQGLPTSTLWSALHSRALLRVLK